MIRPIELFAWLVNHRAPSGPTAIPVGSDGRTCVLGHNPPVEIRPIELSHEVGEPEGAVGPGHDAHRGDGGVAVSGTPAQPW